MKTLHYLLTEVKLYNILNISNLDENVPIRLVTIKKIHKKNLF